MEPLVSLASRASLAARCAFCHDALGAEWDVCSGCNTRLHPECRVQAIDCPTLGCRMSMVRLQWMSPYVRTRPAFRHALARIAERHDSGRLESLGEISDELDAHRKSLAIVLTLIGHALLSPFALVGFVVYFAVLYVPAHWLGALVRRPGIARRVRGQVQGAAFSFEALFAPFVTMSLAALLPIVLLTGSSASPFTGFMEVLYATIVVIPPALSWFDRT
jgi:hypothetical protein